MASNSKLPQVPDALSSTQRSELVINTLQQLQVDEVNLQLARLRAAGNGAAPSGVYRADGTSLSIDEQSEMVANAQRALTEQYADLMGEIQAIIDQRAAASDAAES